MGISIIVLAAGSSVRMGESKPMLDFDGETCLSLVLAACLGSRADETVVVLGAASDRVLASIPGVGPDGTAVDGRLKVVINKNHERGQTSTLKTGLESASARADAFIVFPVDHPLVTSDDIDALIDRFEPRPRGRTIFIASHEAGRGHPVLFAAGHRAAILELGDDEPLHGYIRVKEGEIEQVVREGVGVVLPMNTPEEYQKVLGLYRARKAVAP